MTNPTDTETDPLATVPAEEQTRIVEIATKERHATGMRTTAPWAGEYVYEKAIAREVAAWHAAHPVTEPHVIKDGKADRPGSGLYGRLTGEELQAARAAAPETRARAETCNCGHEKSDHAAAGHGACTAVLGEDARCVCRGYSRSDAIPETLTREDAEATPWNWCPRCKQTVDDDMRTGEFRDGSEGTCIGCKTVYVATSWLDGSWTLAPREEDVTPAEEVERDPVAVHEGYCGALSADAMACTRKPHTDGEHVAEGVRGEILERWTTPASRGDIPEEDQKRILAAAKEAGNAAFTSSLGPMMQGDYDLAASAANAVIASEMAAWHAARLAPVPPPSPAYPDCCLRHRTNGPRASSCGSLAYTGPDATPETLMREGLPDHVCSCGVTVGNHESHPIGEGCDLGAASYGGKRAPPPVGPRDVVGEALAAMVAFFTFLFVRRASTAAHTLGELAALDLLFRPEVPAPRLIELRDLCATAAEEHAEIRRLASERLTRVAKVRRERKAADRAAGRITEEELAAAERCANSLRSVASYHARVNFGGADGETHARSRTAAENAAELLSGLAAEVRALRAENKAHASTASAWRTTADRYCDTIAERDAEIERLRAELAARPAPAASLEARAQKAHAAWVADRGRHLCAWDDLPAAERTIWLAVVRAADASRPGLPTPERAATVIAFLRENFLNDGAEGESVHLACNMLEAALASRPGLTEGDARAWAHDLGRKCMSLRVDPHNAVTAALLRASRGEIGGAK